MKKALIFVILFVLIGKIYAQVEVIQNKSLSVKTPMSYPFGINIDLVLSGKQRWAREYNFSYNSTGNVFSFGAVANGNDLEYGYIGGNNKSNNTNYMSPWISFLPNGNIGIGTINPSKLLEVNGEIKSKQLTVAGTILAREVKIEVTAGADYIFNNNHKLKSLSEVETYINEKKHLPDIPSEKDMITNGISVNEMQIKLLQKIEELTLYVIEQNKKIEVLERENQEIRMILDKN